MSEPSPELPPVLDYRGRGSENKPTPGLLPALLLCLPGAACFGMLMLGGMDVGQLWLGDIFFPMWGLAVITAVISVVKYLPSHKPWYVNINLFINICGLLLSVPGVAAL